MLKNIVKKSPDFTASFTVKNPDYKVKLHWITENDEAAFEENIELMYPIHPLKYAMGIPVSEKVVEEWEDGKI